MPFILLLLLLINLITFIVFGYDKQLARKNKWRIPERNLFILVILGGTIGGLLGMRAFRHKTNKTSFLFKFYGILILQLVLFYFGFDFFKRFS